MGFIHISPSFLKGVENLYGVVYLFLLIWVAWQHRASLGDPEVTQAYHSVMVRRESYGGGLLFSSEVSTELIFLNM